MNELKNKQQVMQGQKRKLHSKEKYTQLHKKQKSTRAKEVLILRNNKERKKNEKGG